VIPPHEAAWEVHEFLTHAGVAYAIIGGIAVQHWGEPRLTVDLDVTVAAPPDGPQALVRTIVARFASRRDDAIAFARQSRVVLIRATNGFPVDISLAVPGYEDEVMLRAVDFTLEPGKVVRMVSAEDLIVHKAVAGRPQDLLDIRGVVFRQQDRLEPAYIRRWLRDFAAALDMPEIADRFEEPWRRIHREHRP
jgi:hypothetical protein